MDLTVSCQPAHRSPLAGNRSGRALWGGRTRVLRETSAHDSIAHRRIYRPLPSRRPGRRPPRKGVSRPATATARRAPSAAVCCGAAGRTAAEAETAQISERPLGHAKGGAISGPPSPWRRTCDVGRTGAASAGAPPVSTLRQAFSTLLYPSMRCGLRRMTVDALPRSAAVAHLRPNLAHTLALDTKDNRLPRRVHFNSFAASAKTCGRPRGRPTASAYCWKSIYFIYTSGICFLGYTLRTYYFCGILYIPEETWRIVACAA